MSKLFEQFKQEMIADAELFESYLDKQKNFIATPTDIENLYKAKHRVKQATSIFIKKITSDISFSKIEETVLNSDSSDKEEFYENFLKKTAKLIGSNGKANFKDSEFVKKFLSMPKEERSSYIETTLSELEPSDAQIVKQELLTEFVFLMKMDTLPTKDVIEAGYHRIELNKFDIKDEYIPEKESYTHAFDLGDKSDVPLMNEEIDKYLEVADKNDKELIAALLDSKKILVHGKEGIWHDDDPSEFMGDASNILSNLEAMEDYEKIDAFTGKNIKLTRTAKQIDFDFLMPTHDKSEIVNEIYNNRIVLTEEITNNIKNMYDQVINSGLDLENAFVKPGPNESIAQGIDAWEHPIHDQLQNAIKEKNAEEVKKLSSQYRNFEKAFDKMIADFEKINPTDRYPGNLSLARSRDVPAKYRNNIAGISKIDGFISTIGVCKRVGYDFNNFITDPIKAFKELSDLGAKNAYDKINGLLNGLDLTSAIYAITDGQDNSDTISSRINKEERDLKHIERVSDMFGPILGEKGARKFYSQAYVINAYLNDHIKQIGNVTEYRSSPQTHFKVIDRMILTEKEDRNFFALSPKVIHYLDPNTLEPKEAFNEKEYYKTKTNAAAVASRALEVFEGYSKEPYNRAVSNKTMKLVAQKALDHIPENERSYDIKVVIDAMKSDRLKKITPKVRENLALQAGLMKFKNQKVTSANVTDAMAKLSAVQNIYNKHGFFSKLFNSNIKNEKRLLDSMYQKISQDTGAKVKDLKDVVSKQNKGETAKFTDTVGNMKNSLAEKERAEKIENYNKRYRSIYNSEEKNRTRIIINDLNEAKVDTNEYDLDKSVYLSAEDLNEINNDLANEDNQMLSEDNHVM